MEPTYEELEAQLAADPQLASLATNDSATNVFIFAGNAGGFAGFKLAAGEVTASFTPRNAADKAYIVQSGQAKVLVTTNTVVTIETKGYLLCGLPAPDSQQLFAWAGLSYSYQ